MKKETILGMRWIALLTAACGILTSICLIAGYHTDFTTDAFYIIAGAAAIVFIAGDIKY